MNTRLSCFLRFFVCCSLFFIAFGVMAYDGATAAENSSENVAAHAKVDLSPIAQEVEEGLQYHDLLGVPVGWRGAKDSLLKSLDWGIEQRFRYEMRDAIGFNDRRNEDFLLSRTRLWIEGEISSFADFKVEGRDARAFWSDNEIADDSPVFEDDFDIFQAYLTFKYQDTWKLRVGRELLAFDDQRLIGGLFWTNTSRTFNTVHGIYDGEKFEAHLGAANVVQVDPDSFNDVNDNDDLYYLHTTFKDIGPAETKLSTFVYHRDRPNIESTTLGARLFGELVESGLDYDIMAAFQTGSGESADVSAHAAHAELGYTFSDVAWTPRLALEANIASGDDDPTGGDIETFDQLFPTNHNKYGIADLVGFRNQRNLGVHLETKPDKKTKANLAYYAFWVDEEEDALYNAGGGAIVGGSRGSSDFVGQEIDIELSYKFTDYLTGAGGVGYFFTGDFIEENSQQSDDFVFAFAQLVFKLH